MASAQKLPYFTMKNKTPCKYFKVYANRGHLGAGKSGEIIFYIKAKQICDAVEHAQKMPGVKHGQFIAKALEISHEEYIKGRKISAYAQL